MSEGVSWPFPFRMACFFSSVARVQEPGEVGVALSNPLPPLTILRQKPPIPINFLDFPVQEYHSLSHAKACSVVKVGKRADKGSVAMLDERQKIVCVDDARPRSTLLFVCV